MKPTAQQPVNDIPVEMVGSNKFGRIPNISAEQTFNMIISDDWLVESPGYKKVLHRDGNVRGRAIYSSIRGNFMLAVISNVVYKIQGPKEFLTIQEVFRLESFSGDVFIAENLLDQIAICDQQDFWVYNFTTGIVIKAVLPAALNNPGYVTYHDGYFIVPDSAGTQWFLTSQTDGSDFFWGPANQPVAGAIQTKPETPVAVLRAPSKGNLIYVFGRNVMEMWYDNGGQLFPYQRQNSVSVDYGCLSPTTIATMDNYVAWLGVNEKSGPVIMVSDGGGFNRLSNDGIDFRLSNINRPELSYAFFFKQDGHVFYQITFYDSSDNFTLLYDFTTQAFFYLTDEYMNYHIAESVAFFNNTYYFVSINDGSIYELSSDYKTYDYTLPSNLRPNPNPNLDKEIPRMRVLRGMKQVDTSPFIGNSLTFTVDTGSDKSYKGDGEFYLMTEDGVFITQEHQEGFVGPFVTADGYVDAYLPRIDMAVSKDGGESFSNFVTKELNPIGKRKNKVVFWRLGRVNDLVLQFRFWSKDRVNVTNGVLQARTM